LLELIEPHCDRTAPSPARLARLHDAISVKNPFICKRQAGAWRCAFHRLLSSVFESGATNGRLAPTATLGLCLGEVWHRADFYVDSSAVFSIVHGDFASDAGFDFTTGERTLVKVGDGSLIPVSCIACRFKLARTGSKPGWAFPTNWG
jgi:hypothetical protein